MGAAMKNTDYDVLIIGAGPAGAMSAYLLARRGFRVLLAEKSSFPRYKVCGGCVSAVALSILQRNGLAERIRATKGQGLSTAHLQCGNSSTCITLPGGIAVSRELFDQRLVCAAEEAGATFCSETLAQLTELYKDKRTITLNSKNEMLVVSASIVIAANGLSNLPGSTSKMQPFSNRKRYVGVGVRVPQKILSDQVSSISMTAAAHGYLGAATIEDSHTLLAAALDPASFKSFGGINSAVAEIAKSNSMYRDFDFGHLHFSATPLLSQRLVPVSQQRLFVVGDAAGFVEPFTGEGIAWALRGAEIVAELAEQALTVRGNNFERVWLKSHRYEIGRKHVRCHYLTQALRIPLVAKGVMRLGKRTGAMGNAGLASLLHGKEVIL
jgi:flavin-dependent dehydrogenase